MHKFKLFLKLSKVTLLKGFTYFLFNFNINLVFDTIIQRIKKICIYLISFCCRGVGCFFVNKSVDFLINLKDILILNCKPKPKKYPKRKNGGREKK
jgi:hypothetical protein